MTSRLPLIWQTELIGLTFGSGLDSSGSVPGTQSLLIDDRLLEASYLVGIVTQSYQVERDLRNGVLPYLGLAG